MKVPPTSSGNVLHGQFQERNQTKRSPLEAKTFDIVVAGYYPAVYSFACRFTDDPRKAHELTCDAFDSAQKQLQARCDENVLASILISNVIRAVCRLNRTSRRPPNLKTRNNNLWGVMVLTGFEAYQFKASIHVKHLAKGGAYY